MSNAIATWTISLDVRCPHCTKLVDLLDHPDFWDGRGRLIAGEHDTPASTNMEVECPECDGEFTVDLQH